MTRHYRYPAPDDHVHLSLGSRQIKSTPRATISALGGG